MEYKNFVENALMQASEIAKEKFGNVGIMVVRGGAVGAIIGIYAIYNNYQIIGSAMPKSKKIMLVTAYTIGAFILFLVIAFVLYLLVYSAIDAGNKY